MKAKFSIITVLMAISLGSASAGVLGIGSHSEQGVVKGDINQVNQTAQKSLQQMGGSITETQMKSAGKEQDISGKIGDKDIDIKMKTASANTTSVEVSSDDENNAKNVLNKIVTATG